MLDRIRIIYYDLVADLPTLRCIFGVTLALVGGTTIAYPAAHMTAIFTLMFLSPGKKAFKFIAVVKYPFFLYLLGWIGVFMGSYLIEYPFVILPLLALFIFLSFRLVKVPVIARLVFLILIVLIPFMSLTANALGGFVLSLMIVNLTIALLIASLCFILFPDPELNIIQEKKAAKAATAPPPINMDKVAFNGLMVIFPLIVVFFFYNATIGLLTLVFAVILAFDPFIYQSKKGWFMLLANIWGGIFGILAYQVLVMAPNYLLYIFLSTSISFYFVLNLYAGKKTSPIYGTSFNTFFMVMGTISTSTDEAGSTVWGRVFQIGIALIYVIVAYKIVNIFNNPLKSES